MALYAIIENDVVTQLSDIAHDDKPWVEVPSNAEYGDIFVGGVLNKRPDRFHDWNGSEWVQNTDKQWVEIRAKRDGMLAACDWTMVADAPTDKVAWAAYRQALRDVPTQPDPFNITWPEPPNQ